MKILLATPPLHPYQSYNYKFPRFPIYNLPLLAATLRPDHQVRILNHAARPRRPDPLQAVAAEWAPEVIGFALPSAVSALALAPAIARLKTARPGTRVIAGGPFPSYEAEYCLRKLGCDAVLLGEGERAFREWIADPRPDDQRRGVADLGADGRMRHGGFDLLDDLNQAPFPAWELLDYPPAIYTGKRAAVAEMSRGCPYDCTFCVVHAFGKRYRAKSPERGLEELGRLWEMGVRELLFVDNSFALGVEESTQLLEGMLHRDWHFEFGAYLRADTIAEQPELMRLGVRAGLRYALVGFESYNDAGLSAMRKATKRETNLRAATTARQVGLLTIGSHIYGAPGESAADMRRTYRYGTRHSDLYKAGMFTPLPGSVLHRDLAERGELETGDPLAMDYTHYRLGDARQRRRMTALMAWLFMRYYFGPARLARLFSRRLWVRRIFRAEYRTIARRVVLTLWWWNAGRRIKNG